MVTIELNYEGYWLEANKGDIPCQSGIYCVYSCRFNKEAHTVSIDELLYIGESVDVNNRIANHERAGDWKKALSGSQTLCYSFAPVMNPNRERAEAALIYKHKPPMNDEYINNFPYNDTVVKLTGIIRKLKDLFIVYQTK